MWKRLRVGVFVSKKRRNWRWVYRVSAAKTWEPGRGGVNDVPSVHRKFKQHRNRAIYSGVCRGNSSLLGFSPPFWMQLLYQTTASCCAVGLPYHQKLPWCSETHGTHSEIFMTNLKWLVGILNHQAYVCYYLPSLKLSGTTKNSLPICPIDMREDPFIKGLNIILNSVILRPAKKKRYTWQKLLQKQVFMEFSDELSLPKWKAYKWCT